MMCKPSAHLVEYLENQNIDVASIIKDLPDELPLTRTRDEDGSDSGSNGGVSSDNASPGVDVKAKAEVEVEAKTDARVQSVVTNSNASSVNASVSKAPVIQSATVSSQPVITPVGQPAALRPQVISTQQVPSMVKLDE